MKTLKIFARQSGRAASIPTGILIILICTSTPSAQEVYLKGLAGWSYAYTSPPHDAVSSLSFGAGLEIWPHKNFGLELDALYVTKGDKSTRYQNSDGTFAEISLPLLLKYRLPIDINNKYYLGLFGGAGYSVILDEMDSNFSSKEIGIIAGANVEVRLEEVTFFFELRHDWGLEEVAIDYIPSRQAFKTRALFLIIGLKLEI